MTKVNEKDLQLIIDGTIKDCLINNDDIECLESRIALSSLIINLYTSIYPNTNFDILSNNVSKLLDERILVDPPTYTDEDIDNIILKIDYIKNIPQPAQRTEEWYTFRNNRLTASDLATAVDKNPYSNRNKLILSKCGHSEPWTPGPAIIHGQKYEDVAVAIYEKRNNVIIDEYGCIPHKTVGHFGASPDGIVNSDSENTNYIGRMLEIKCPTKRSLTGFIPTYYYYQVQGQLEVCELEYCDFLECKIVEVNRQEYFSSNNEEKGVVLEYYNYELDKNLYHYSTMNIDNKTFESWQDNLINVILEDQNLEYIQTSFWILNEYSCILVKRDRDFWDNILPKINDFWQDVLKYRKIGIESLIDKKKRKNNKKDTLNFID